MLRVEGDHHAVVGTVIVVEVLVHEGHEVEDHRVHRWAHLGGPPASLRQLCALHAVHLRQQRSSDTVDCRNSPFIRMTSRRTQHVTSPFVSAEACWKTPIDVLCSLLYMEAVMEVKSAYHDLLRPVGPAIEAVPQAGVGAIVEVEPVQRSHCAVVQQSPWPPCHQLLAPIKPR